MPARDVREPFVEPRDFSDYARAEAASGVWTPDTARVA
jgi:hypothetical protein